MKITDVTVSIIDAEVAYPFRWRAGLEGSGTRTVTSMVTVHTDEGISGSAEAPRGPIVQDLIERRLKPMVVGTDPLLKEDLGNERGNSTASRSCRSMCSA